MRNLIVLILLSVRTVAVRVRTDSYQQKLKLREMLGIDHRIARPPFPMDELSKKLDVEVSCSALGMDSFEMSKGQSWILIPQMENNSKPEV